MLPINPEIVCTIIAKAKEFFGKEELNLPEEEAEQMSDDWYYKILADYKDDLTFTELQTNINDLEPDQQAALVTLLWIGRGDFDSAEWTAAFQEAKRVWNNRTADYLLSKPLLADYLEDGLNQCGYQCNE